MGMAWERLIRSIKETLKIMKERTRQEVSYRSRTIIVCKTSEKYNFVITVTFTKYVKHYNLDI